MEEALYDAMVDLKRTIDKQNELQETAIRVMQALVEALNSNSQEMADSRLE